MVKPALSVELTTTSQESVLRQVPCNNNNDRELPNGKTKDWSRAQNTSRLRPNRDTLVNKTYICCTPQIINTSGIIHLSQPITVLLRGNTANTQYPHRPWKEKVLCYPAHVCNWEQNQPSDIPDRHHCHLQYLVWRCPHQANVKHEAYNVTLPTSPLKQLPAAETTGADWPSGTKKKR